MIWDGSPTNHYKNFRWKKSERFPRVRAQDKRSTAVWLTRPRRVEWRPVLEAMQQQLSQTTLWRRQMVLGPGKEFALIVPPGLNVAAPAGWSALAIERVRVDVPINTQLT